MQLAFPHGQRTVLQQDSTTHIDLHSTEAVPEAFLRFIEASETSRMPCVQITEKEERKRREKEEMERYDVKLEADMMAYNPWGRSGGGASIKDENGNLVSKFGFTLSFNEVDYT